MNNGSIAQLVSVTVSKTGDLGSNPNRITKF